MVEFEWDDAKAARNLRRHGVSFEEGREVVEHPLAITVDDPAHSDVEEREKTIGWSARGRVLVVIHTRPDRNVVRIISARKAGRQEIRDYEEEIRQRIAGN